MESKLKISFFILIFTLLLNMVPVSSLSGQAEKQTVYEHHEIRREFKNVIFGSNIDINNQRTAVEYCFFTGKYVKFEILAREGYYYFIFINEAEALFPFVSSGTYIIRRSISSGAIDQIKIFLNSDPDTFIRISASQRGSTFEMYLFGSRIYSNILLPVTIENLVIEPFSLIRDLSAYIVDWSLFTSFYNLTENMIVRDMAEQIAARIPELKDSDDGAQDRSGNFVFIETLEENAERGFNCSGFAKWICDGLFKAKASGVNSLIDITDLKRKNIVQRSNTLSLIYEDIRDPFFGLDWTRNLGLTLYSLEYLDSSESAGADISMVDVRNYPYDNYIHDAGYNINNLTAILYYLTVTNPGYIYLASVNGDFGTDPVLRQHYHVAVFLPYINENNDFVPEVFETNRKTDIKDFIRRYPDHQIHLVRVKASKDFTLP